MLLRCGRTSRRLGGAVRGFSTRCADFCSATADHSAFLISRPSLPPCRRRRLFALERPQGIPIIRRSAAREGEARLLRRSSLGRSFAEASEGLRSFSGGGCEGRTAEPKPAQNNDDAVRREVRPPKTGHARGRSRQVLFSLPRGKIFPAATLEKTQPAEPRGVTDFGRAGIDTFGRILTVSNVTFECFKTHI